MKWPRHRQAVEFGHIFLFDREKYIFFYKLIIRKLPDFGGFFEQRFFCFAVIRILLICQLLFYLLQKFNLYLDIFNWTTYKTLLFRRIIRKLWKDYKWKIELFIYPFFEFVNWNFHRTNQSTNEIISVGTGDSMSFWFPITYKPKFSPLKIPSNNFTNWLLLFLYEL